MIESAIQSVVKKNLEDIHRRLEKAAHAAGRRPEEIRLIGICKHQPLENVEAALNLGLKELGQNYVQELIKQKAALEEKSFRVSWHFVGSLQTNKAKNLLKAFGAQPPLLHTLDRLELAQALNKAALQLGLQQPIPCLLQILPDDLIAERKLRGGCPIDEVLPLIQNLKSLPMIALRGLMVLPKADSHAQKTFSAVRKLGEELQTQVKLPRERFSMTEYSMGMTDDFEHAILAGATLLRIGTGIFGSRLARV